jgi:hypothetical protein
VHPHGRTAAAALLLWATVLGAEPGSGPGEPFGGDDAGCVPASEALRRCSSTASKALAKLERVLVTCHLRAADARYAAVVLGQPAVFDEAACAATARVRFDTALARLGTRGMCTGGPVLSTAAAAGDDQVAAVDVQNGAVHCDPTSGVLIDPADGDGGYVPASDGSRRCADRVAKNLRKLALAAARCHQKAADAGFRLADPPFDEDACEAVALGRYATGSARALTAGGCPSCLEASAQAALAATAVARLDAANDGVYPCPDPSVRVDTVQLDRPTLIALGVQVLISGDADHDAAITMRYRPVGAPAWADALPLVRVRPESVEGRVVPEQFAGSIFDLRPSTTYEIELHATDADGAVDETHLLVATTRAVPGDPAMPRVVPVSDASSLAAALAAARPGDVISLADGIYGGAFGLSASGTAADPIVIRGASTAGTILDGGGCDCNVIEVYGSFVHVERLTLRNATRGLRFQTAAAEGNVVRRVRIEDTRLGIGSRQDQLDFYLCDNVLEGRLAWPHVYSDDGGAHSDDDGILIQGHGHVVCHNRIRGYGDAIKTAQAGARAIDVYGNEVLSAYDNGVELDYGEGNVRCWRNRFTNTYTPLSFQPIYGGPAYAIRNVVVNVADEQLKFHGVGGATGPSGVLAYHNTFVSPARALSMFASVAGHHFRIRNNLFVGPQTLEGTKTVDWLGAIDDGAFEGDGYYPDGMFRFNLPPGGVVSHASFAAMQAAGMETSGLLLAEPIFAGGLVAPASYALTLAPQDVTPDATSAAVDAAGALANVSTAFAGTGPDLGAIERGCPPPIFGVRSEGVDEANEPFGCEL